MSEVQNQNTQRAGAYYTIKQAAKAKNIPYWKLSRILQSQAYSNRTLGLTRAALS